MAGRLCPFLACCSARVLSPCQCLSEPSPGHQLFPESRDWALATQLAPKGWVCFCELRYVSAAWWGILLQRQQVGFPAEPRSPGTSRFKQWKHSVKNSHFPVPYVFFWWVDKYCCPPPPDTPPGGVLLLHCRKSAASPPERLRNSVSWQLWALQCFPGRWMPGLPSRCERIQNPAWTQMGGISNHPWCQGLCISSLLQVTTFQPFFLVPSLTHFLIK